MEAVAVKQAHTPGPSLAELSARLDEPCVVCMIDAKHRDGRKGDAYIGASLQFDTLDQRAARVFPRWQADDYADHWRGWYRGFAGGVKIEVRAAIAKAQP